MARIAKGLFRILVLLSSDSDVWLSSVGTRGKPPGCTATKAVANQGLLSATPVFMLGGHFIPIP
jgi:hypothetical protein